MLAFLAISLLPAQAWEGRKDTMGQQLRWSGEQITYQINPHGNHGLSSTAIDTLISAATRSWTDPVNGKLRFDNGGKTTIRKASHTDQTNVIYFEDVWTQDPELLAVTYIWSNTEGEIIGFDMALNAEDHQWSIDGSPESNDLLNTLSHEFGHVLGIDHSPLEALATMYATSPPGELLKRDLHTDDVEAVTHLYAHADQAEEDAAGCSTARPQMTGLSGQFLILLLSIVVVSRRHRSPLDSLDTSLPASRLRHT